MLSDRHDPPYEMWTRLTKSHFPRGCLKEEMEVNRPHYEESAKQWLQGCVNLDTRGAWRRGRPKTTNMDEELRERAGWKTWRAVCITAAVRADSRVKKPYVPLGMNRWLIFRMITGRAKDCQDSLSTQGLAGLLNLQIQIVWTWQLFLISKCVPSHRTGYFLNNSWWLFSKARRLFFYPWLKEENNESLDLKTALSLGYRKY